MAKHRNEACDYKWTRAAFLVEHVLPSNWTDRKRIFAGITGY